MTAGIQPRGLVLACPAVLGSGGVAAYARAVVEAVAPVEVQVLGHGRGRHVATLSENGRLRAESAGQTGFAFQLARVYASRRPTVFVFAHIGLLAPLALLPRRRAHRVVLMLHGMEAWFRVGMRRAVALPRVDTLVCTTRYTRELFLAYNGDRLAPDVQVEVIPLSASESLERQSPVPAADRPRSRIVCVSRLTREEPLKGIETILEAAARLDPVDHEVTIVGDGDARGDYEERSRRLGVADRVTFRGWVSDEEKAEAIASADVFCLPSAQEGFGIVYLEALVAGRPCVGAAAGAVPEVLPPAVSELVPYGDAPALAEALQRVTRKFRTGELRPETVRAEYDRCFPSSAFRRRWRDFLDGMRTA